MATKAEVRQRVGEDLSLVPVGQDLEYQDQARIDATYDEIYKRLKIKGLATWASDAEVPDELVPALVLLMLSKLAGITYGVPPDRFERIAQEAGANGDLAEAMLAELAVNAFDDTDEVDDF